MTEPKTKDWLLLNAIECWLYFCSTSTQYRDDYVRLRDEYKQLLESSKDATPTVNPTTKRKPSRAKTTNAQ